MKFNSIKTQLIIFFTIFAIFLSFKDRDALFLLTTSLSVFLAIGYDAALSFQKNKKIIVTESSIISGLIIGFLLYSKQPWRIFVLTPLFAIGSKHLLRFKDRHIFNPAAFGIFLTIILLGAQTQWKGTYLWYILAPVGLYFISKIRKLEVLIGYGLTALALFGIQAVLQKEPFLNIFGYLSYFYIFVMVIEPKTTPVRPLGKFLFGIGGASLVFILTEVGVKFDAELCSLLVLNLFVPLLNKIPK